MSPGPTLRVVDTAGASGRAVPAIHWLGRPVRIPDAAPRVTP